MPLPWPPADKVTITLVSTAPAWPSPRPPAPSQSAGARTTQLDDAGGQSNAREGGTAAAAPRHPSPRWRGGRVGHPAQVRAAGVSGVARAGRSKGGPPRGEFPARSPHPRPTSWGAPNPPQTHESCSAKPLLSSHLLAGSSRAAAELRAPTRPPFIHLSPPP